MQGRVIPEKLNELQIFPKKYWKNEIIKISKLGFDHVELLWDKKGIIKEYPDIITIIKKISTLSVPSICLDTVTRLNNYSELINELHEIIAFFGHNIPKILVIPLLENMSLKNDKKLKNLINKIANDPISNILRSKQVVLSLELDLKANEISKVFSNLSDPLFSLCLDTGNFWQMSENPEEELLMLLPFVNHVHVKDKNRNGKNVMLSSGIVNFDFIFKVLKSNNYSQHISLETNYFKEPAKEALENLNFIKQYKKLS